MAFAAINFSGYFADAIGVIFLIDDSIGGRVPVPLYHTIWLTLTTSVKVSCPCCMEMRASAFSMRNVDILFRLPISRAAVISISLHESLLEHVRNITGRRHRCNELTIDEELSQCFVRRPTLTRRENIPPANISEDGYVTHTWAWPIDMCEFVWYRIRLVPE